jgi:hypothetical protein
MRLGIAGMWIRRRGASEAGGRTEGLASEHLISEIVYITMYTEDSPCPNAVFRSPKLERSSPVW